MFWMGGEFSANRQRSLDGWKDLGFSPRLLLESDIFAMSRRGEIQLHHGFRFLTAVHKSDYLRSQFMYRFGGLYSDIKPPPPRIVSKTVRTIRRGVSFAGYQEVGFNGVPPACGDAVRKHWRKLAGNGHFFFQPGTDFAREWFSRVNSALDVKLERLENDSHIGLERFPIRNGSNVETYPFRWAEIHGEIFQPLQAEFGYPAELLLPRPVVKGYI
jgi:hypothetical protein